MPGETMPQRTIEIGKGGAVVITETPYPCEKNMRKKSDEAAAAAWSVPKPAKVQAKKVEAPKDEE